MLGNASSNLDRASSGTLTITSFIALLPDRFLFTYVPMSDGARIDVTVSELYDSTYVGNPHDLVNLWSAA